MKQVRTSNQPYEKDVETTDGSSGQTTITKDTIVRGSEEMSEIMDVETLTEDTMPKATGGSSGQTSITKGKILRGSDEKDVQKTGGSSDQTSITEDVQETGGSSDQTTITKDTIVRGSEEMSEIMDVETLTEDTMPKATGGSSGQTSITKGKILRGSDEKDVQKTGGSSDQTSITEDVQETGGSSDQTTITKDTIVRGSEEMSEIMDVETLTEDTMPKATGGSSGQTSITKGKILRGSDEKDVQKTGGSSDQTSITEDVQETGGSSDQTTITKDTIVRGSEEMSEIMDVETLTEDTMPKATGGSSGQTSITKGKILRGSDEKDVQKTGGSSDQTSITEDVQETGGSSDQTTITKDTIVRGSEEMSEIMDVETLTEDTMPKATGGSSGQTSITEDVQETGGSSGQTSITKGRLVRGSERRQLRSQPKLTQKMAEVKKATLAKTSKKTSKSTQRPQTSAGTSSKVSESTKSKEMKPPIATSLKFKKVHNQSANSTSTFESSFNTTMSSVNKSAISNVSVDDIVPEIFSSDDSIGQPSNVVRQKKIERQWMVDRSFENAEEAKSFVKTELVWSIATTNYIFEGKKVLYRCKKAKQRGKQCECAIALLYLYYIDEVQLLRTLNKHTCENNPSLYHPLLPETKNKITELFMNGCRKRKDIQAKLASLKIDMPSLNQLNNLIKELRKQKFGTPKMTMGELEAKLIEHKVIPDDDDDPFVVDYIIDYETEDFKFFISTKNLLRNIVNAKIVSTDTAYKMNWEGFPIAPVGTTDMDKHFHLFGTMVSKEEQTKDFEFMFATLKNAALELFGYQMKPTILIADAADAIKNAFIAVFGLLVLILMCWFHVKKAVKKNFKDKKVHDKQSQQSILDDLDKLHLARSPEEFHIAAGLFLEKWQKFEEFCEYFENEWLIQHRNWYEGAIKQQDVVQLGPSTNNSMESWNRTSKDEKTKRIRLPLNQFFKKMLQWTTEWSQQYTSKAKTYVHKPTINTKLWTKSYKWARLNKKLKRCTDETTGLFYYDVTAGLSTSTPMLSLPTNWENFDEYKNVNFSQFRVHISENWQEGICNCPAFTKQYICKHVVGIAIRLKLTDTPVQAKALPIEQKRKPGRPRLTKKALERQ